MESEINHGNSHEVMYVDYSHIAIMRMYRGVFA